ncbi:AraC family transcriptional regulator (plasmid) [Phyllobacterium sp. 628]|uniref:AraC family transcriptional regulator n=1 Tax=Phyllobacterium sp. 628 TaxID=2718938 RepID=UPI00166280E4|nr:helix-turn-helix domain-containing protein [Phyllobacterium sp. 628]QND54826.1 AraC family transcriptional regulator [Phyllobacterium sp. 628]
MLNGTVDRGLHLANALHQPIKAEQIQAAQQPRQSGFPNLIVDKTHVLKEAQILKGTTPTIIHSLSDGAADLLLYIFVLSGSFEIYNTKTRQSEFLLEGYAGTVVNNPAVILRLSENTEWLALQLPLQQVKQHFEFCSKSLTCSGLQFSIVPDFHNHPVTALRHTLASMNRGRGEGSKNSALLDASYEHLLLTQIYSLAPHNFSGGIRSAPQQLHPKQLRRAEEFMRRNLYRAVNIQDIANAAGCSTRTLQRIFRSFRDATPIQILFRYRIAEAHEAIISGQATTVTDLAAALQFSNAGRFAVIYRKLYGKTPSSVMRFYCNE